MTTAAVNKWICLLESQLLRRHSNTVIETKFKLASLSDKKSPRSTTVVHDTVQSFSYTNLKMINGTYSQKQHI